MRETYPFRVLVPVDICSFLNEPLASCQIALEGSMHQRSHSILEEKERKKEEEEKEEKEEEEEEEEEAWDGRERGEQRMEWTEE